MAQFLKKKKITENRLRQSSMHSEFSAQKWESAIYDNRLKLASSQYPYG